MTNLPKLLSALAAWFQRTFGLPLWKAFLHAFLFLGNRAVAVA